VLKILVASLILIAPSVALADADCKANPKEQWKSEADARKKFEGEGYKIKKFKVSGNCYEIYGWNKEGKKAEIYFDTATLDVVKSEID
jgi:hypothetical protein